MAEGSSRATWIHTSAIICMLARVNGDPKAKPRDFNPWEQLKPAPDETLPGDIQVLKVFVNTGESASLPLPCPTP